MKFIWHLSIHLLVEFLLCWILSVVFLMALEPKINGTHEALLVGVSIQITQITMRFLLLSFLIIWFVNLKLKYYGTYREAIITSGLMVFHVSILAGVVSILTQAEDIIFGSVSVWMPIWLGILLAPFIVRPLRGL